VRYGGTPYCTPYCIYGNPDAAMLQRHELHSRSDLDEIGGLTHFFFGLELNYTVQMCDRFV
jgi:hypothetical protein